MARPAPRALLVLLLSTLALVAAPAVLPTVTPTSAEAASDVQDVHLVNRINDERARNGLPALQMVEPLRTAAALPWSRRMADMGRLEHNPNLRSAVASISPRWSRFTENVGFGPSVDQVHGALMSSSGHRANILDRDVRYVAVGTVLRNGSWWVTQDFFGSSDSLAVVSHNPIGALDSVTVRDGAITASGWALDPDTASPISVHLYADGAALANLGSAAGSRPDVAAAFPSYGAARGFSGTRTLRPGSHDICAFAINTGPGGNSLIGCRTVTVPGGSPIGALDGVTGGYQSVRVHGWAIDPDTTDPVAVHVYADGRGLASLGLARGSRPDVGAAFPGYGSAHGYDSTLALSEGRHRLCAYGINVGPGRNTLLGCRDVVVDGPAAHSPFGVLDTAASTGSGIRVSGWTIDPDTDGAISVAVLVDGKNARGIAADLSRPDVDAAFGRGARHGFDVVVPASRGTHQVCVVAMNTAQGANTTLNCRTVTV